MSLSALCVAGRPTLSRAREGLRGAGRMTLSRLRDMPALQRALVLSSAAWTVLVLIGMVGLLVPANHEDLASAPLPPRAASLPSSADLSEIAKRPVFSRSRAAAIVSAPVAPPSPEVMRDRSIRVGGIVIDGAVAKAFLSSGGNPTGAWMKVGDAVGGWTIGAIRPTVVNLGAQGETLSLSVNPTDGMH